MRQVILQAVGIVVPHMVANNLTVITRGVESVSLLKETPTPGPIFFIWTYMCNFVAVNLTSMQFILQLKLCLYKIVQLLLKEFKISLKSSLSTQSLCHTVSPRVGVWSPKFSNPGVKSRVPQKTRTLHPW